MNDLETRLREVLNEEGARAPSPLDPRGVIKRTRRRQAIVAASAVLAVVAATGLAFAGLRAVVPPATPAAPSKERTVNGVTMKVPAGWHLVDPVEAGLQPAGDTLPRLIGVLSVAEPSSVLPCPGRTAIGRNGFVLTLSEEPLAIDGAAARPWPVDLESMQANGSDSACYPEWEFLHAGWTTSGRTFEARVGIGPDVTEEDRVLLLDAFASMEFRQGQERASIVLATGTAAGEDWELIATRDADGLVLGLEWPSGGSGLGGLHDRKQPLYLTSHVFGSGHDARVVVFGAVDPSVVRVELFPALGGPAESAEVIDVPDRIDPQLNAFVGVAVADLPVRLEAYDAAGTTVAQETVGEDPEVQSS